MTNLNELKQLPTLSTKAEEFVDTWDGESIPEDIRLELEKYHAEMTPIVTNARAQLKAILASAVL